MLSLIVPCTGLKNVLSKIVSQIVVEDLGYKMQGEGFKTWRGKELFSKYLILPDALDPGVYSACNSRERPVRKADNLTAIRDPIA
jgi:hypothetical protein